MNDSFKNLIMILFVLLFMLDGTASAAKNSKHIEPKGFNGIAWDEPASKYKHVLQENWNDPLAPPYTQRFTRKTDVPYFGKAYTGIVNYIFDDMGFIYAQSEFEYNSQEPGKFKSYELFEQNITNLIAVCTQKWGAYDKEVTTSSISKITKYNWQSQNTITSIEINRMILSNDELGKTKKIIAICLFKVASIDGMKRTEKNLQEYEYNGNSNDNF